jgi:peroxiredoxin Q/BCP
MAAPDFALPDGAGKTHQLADYKGRKVLIYFYPKDDTPGCTAQACALNDNLSVLNKLDLAVLGVSKDSPAKHAKFAAKYGLKFPLLSDETSDMCERYGVWGEKTFMGKKYMGIERSSFLLDETGKITALWRGVKPDAHLEWVKKELGTGK